MRLRFANIKSYDDLEACRLRRLWASDVDCLGGWEEGDYLALEWNENIVGLALVASPQLKGPPKRPLWEGRDSRFYIAIDFEAVFPTVGGVPIAGGRIGRLLENYCYFRPGAPWKAELSRWAISGSCAEEIVSEILQVYAADRQLPDVQIANCEFAFECDQEWGHLVQTALPNVRLCLRCEKPVYLCTTNTALAVNVDKNRCVALYKPVSQNREKELLSEMVLGIPSDL